MTTLEFLIEILGLNEDDVIRAILTSYCPCQVGSLVGSWKQRKNYGHPPKPKDLFHLLMQSDFRCSKCKGTYRLSFDHKDDNRFNSDISNFQVLCALCNREKRSKNGVVKDQSLHFIKFLKSQVEAGSNDSFFTFCKALGIGNGGSGHQKAKFLIHRAKQWSDRKAKHDGK